MSQILNPYKILEVEWNDTLEIIRQAWRRKIIEWHPDKRAVNDEDAGRMFRDIQRAYEILSNDMTRQKYDEIFNDNDDEDEDLDSFLNHLSLETGSKRSEIFEKKMKGWINEYPTRTFLDNVDSELSSIIIELSNKYKEKFKHNLVKIRCNVCHELFYNLNIHKENKKKILNTFLVQYSNSTLDEYLTLNFPNEWNWKPISKVPSIIKELWCNEKWYKLQSLIDSIATSIQILKNKSQIKPFIIDQSIKSVILSIVNIQSIEYLPNISLYINLINNEQRIQKGNFFKNISNNYENDFPRTGSICIVSQTDEMNVLKKLMFQIERQTIFIDKTNSIECNICKERFNFLRNKHRCRMCGHIQCDNCQVWQTCRHFGYIQPVRICLSCSQQHHIYLAKIIMEKILIRIKFINVLFDIFGKKKEFNRVLQCYTYFANEQDWIELAEKFCDEYSLYEFAAVCFRVISTRSDTFWINKANNYFEKKRFILALLCYEQINLSIEKTWLILISTIHDKIQIYLSYYIQCKIEKISNENKSKFLNQLQQYLKENQIRQFAIKQLQLASLSSSEWKNILEEFANKQEYIITIEILLALQPYSQEFTHPFLRSISIFLRNSILKIDEWICWGQN
ncbi:unnamed protein product [Adineta ricciae]|uniref:J domain-containing protein n=1 Tax=Adineta ricciae TaxID=249248 RepID=A0A814XPQ4_ADIRI|nr:unnamed protein product [Adineta ricciae]